MSKPLPFLALTGLILLQVFFPFNTSAQGNLLITPRRVVFEGNRRSMDLNLANIGNDTATYAISLIQIKMTEEGGFETITEPEEGQLFASPYLRYFPRTVTLGPNETQTVKLQLVRSGTLEPGEYRSHLYFRSVPKEKPLGEEEEIIPDPSSIAVKLTPIFGITIPAIIRVGQPSVNVTIAGPELRFENDTTPRLGIVFHRSGNFSAYGSSTINRFDLSNGEIEEVVSLANHDCLLPKLDALGNLYYLKRPSGYAAGRGNPLTDIIDIFLIPFRLLRAIYSYFNFFAIRFTGTPLRSRDGVNVKSRELDEKTVFINGNIIHAQKNLQRNRRSGDKYPGIAPRNWELMRRDASGKTVCLRRGVLDYDVSAQGEIVFSNGKYLIKINKDMSEEVLLKADLVTKIAIENLD